MTGKAGMKRLSTILLLAGSAPLVWCLTVLAGGALFDRYEGWRLSHRPRVASVALQPAARRIHTDPKPHSVIGRLEIPRLNLSTVVLEGDEARDLRYGAGHIPGTALPDEAGNFGIAAHRDSFFRPLRNIVPNDRITIDTPEGTYEYRVQSTEIVRPDDVQVLHSLTSAPGLVLVTCYPFHYLGPAPLRFIVHARRVG